MSGHYRYSKKSKRGWPHHRKRAFGHKAIGKAVAAAVPTALLDKPETHVLYGAQRTASSLGIGSEAWSGYVQELYPRTSLTAPFDDSFRQSERYYVVGHRVSAWIYPGSFSNGSYYAQMFPHTISNSWMEGTLTGAAPLNSAGTSLTTAMSLPVLDSPFAVFDIRCIYGLLDVRAWRDLYAASITNLLQAVLMDRTRIRTGYSRPNNPTDSGLPSTALTSIDTQWRKYFHVLGDFTKTIYPSTKPFRVGPELWKVKEVALDGYDGTTGGTFSGVADRLVPVIMMSTTANSQMLFAPELFIEHCALYFYNLDN